MVRYRHYRDTLSHWSVNLAVHTAVTLVRYGRNRDTLVSRLSCTYSSYTGQIRTLQRHWSVDLAVHTAVTLVRYGHYRDTLVSRLSCFTAVTLVRYGHYRDTLVSRLSCTYSSYTGQIRTLQRHTGQST